MTDEEIAVRLEGHEHELKSLKHRMNDVEEMTESINKLALSVERLATSVNEALKRQEAYESRLKTQGERIGNLEKADSEKWKQIIKSAVAAIVTGLVCYTMAKIGL